MAACHGLGTSKGGGAVIIIVGGGGGSEVDVRQVGSLDRLEVGSDDEVGGLRERVF